MGCRLSVKVASDYGLQGHRAVEFRIQGRTCNPLTWALATPRKLPRVPRCGCARKLVLPRSDGSLETIDEQYRAVLQCIEAEVCRRNDLVDDHGRPLDAFLGRGNGAVFVQRRAIPPRAAGDLGEAANPALAFRWIAARAAEMCHLGKVACSGNALTVNQLTQAGNIVQRFCRRFRLEKGRKELGGKYKELDELLDKALGFSLGDDPSFWRNLAEEATTRAHISGKRTAEARRRAWKAWVAKSMDKGAGACHAFVRRQLMEADATVGQAHCLDAAPQTVVDHDLVTWREIWERHKETTTAPWRGHADEGSSLPAVTAQCLRKAARSFKAQTAVGVDGVPPRTVEMLSDELLGVLANLLNSIEESGLWPQSYAVSVLHLIPKPSGGRRPIGLLPTLIRLWEKTRKEAIREWRHKEAMPFSWAGQGRGSEAAVWE